MNRISKFMLAFVLASGVVSCSAPVETAQSVFTFDPEFKAELIPLSFESHGSVLRGFMTLGAGEGPRPTIILLHGFPGGDRDVMGLAGVIPQAGWNALVFNYRGLYTSEGLCTPMNSQEDVRAAIGFITEADTLEKYRIDPEMIFLAGYSYGGWQAVVAAAAEPAVKGIVFIAGADFNFLMKEVEGGTEYGKALEKMLRDVYASPDVRGTDFDAMLAEAVSARKRFDIIRLAPQIADRKILLIGGWEDRNITREDHILPFYRALKRAEARDLEPVLLNDNHAFKKQRILLQKTIVTWLQAQNFNPSASY